MTRHSLFLSFLAVSLFACGGSNKKDTGTPGTGHSSAGDDDDDVDTPVEAATPDAGVESTEPPAPVTFVLTNSAKENLYLNMDKGWSAVIYAYSGEPPNAKSILMFPTHCTASCDATPEEICPLCEEPERVKEIKAAEKHDEVAPGDSREVPWDAMVFSYKKARGTQDGKKARCKCYNAVEPPPEAYIIKACGLRKTQTAKKSSKYQCVTSELTLPITEPVRVELDFGK
jgi:hypothetical protein